MKQHINKQQLEELSDKGKERLREWWKPQKGDKFEVVSGYLKPLTSFVHSFNNKTKLIDDTFNSPQLKDCSPLLSIGQMIEFLDEHREEHYGLTNECGDLLRNNLGSAERGFVIWWESDTGLCDALWSACVEILNK